MSKRKFLLLLLATFLVAILILPGCIDYSISTKINEDGSGERVLEVIMDKSLANMTVSGDKYNVEKQLKEGSPKGAKFDTATKDDKIHYKVTFDFKDIADLKKTSKKMSSEEKKGQSPETEKLDLEIKDWFVYAKYKFSEEFPPSGSTQEFQLGEPPTIKYELTLPGKIAEASTDNFEKGTAKWSFDLGKGKKIEASSQLVRWNRIIIIGVAILGLIIILFLIIIFTRKPKSKHQPKEADAPPAQPEM